MLRTRTARRGAVIASTAAALALAALPQVGAMPGLGGLDPVGTIDTVETAFAPQLVTVTADLAGRNVIADSGLDVTEHAGQDFVEVVLHTPADLDVLEALGFPYQVRIADLNAREAQLREADRAYAASVAQSPLPSGRTSYRTLEDYNAEMQDLAATHPDLVRLFELPYPSIEGKTVYGIEIAADVTATDDGRPTMAIMGLHHAREWPSGENTMEFAYDLIGGYGTDARATDLLDRGRIVVVPVVNVDGFEKSITDGALFDLRELNGDDPLDGTTSVLITPGNTYKRKNCRPMAGVDGVPLTCDLLKSPGGYGIGVDLNRNYGVFHGGPGASDNPADPTYYGADGFSEPETQNIHDLVASRHVTMLITNHTFSNLILRPNGVNPETIGPDGLPVGDAPDEDAMADLGARMAEQNGYANQHGWQLYDTTGTTEDWSYNATGGFGYTFEIGPNEFHPPYAEVVDEYLGAGQYEGKGNREAYYIAFETALDPSSHSILIGQATPGARLELTRTGSLPKWDGSFTETVVTETVVPADGTFAWHTNPSTRPIVQARQYKVRNSEPTTQETVEDTTPAVGESVDIEYSFDAPASLGVVDLDWPLPDDLDLEVFRKEADGSLTSIGSSGNLPGEKESVTIAGVEAATYVLRVTNYASVSPDFTLTISTFDADDQTVPGLIETWTLRCYVDDVLVETVPVIVDRGQTAIVDLDVCGPAEKGGKSPKAPKTPKGKR